MWQVQTEPAHLARPHLKKFWEGLWIELIAKVPGLKRSRDIAPWYGASLACTRPWFNSQNFQKNNYYFIIIYEKNEVRYIVKLKIMVRMSPFPESRARDISRKTSNTCHSCEVKTLCSEFNLSGQTPSRHLNQAALYGRRRTLRASTNTSQNQIGSWTDL